MKTYVIKKLQHIAEYILLFIALLILVTGVIEFIDVLGYFINRDFDEINRIPLWVAVGVTFSLIIYSIVSGWLDQAIKSEKPIKNVVSGYLAYAMVFVFLLIFVTGVIEIIYAIGIFINRDFDEINKIPSIITVGIALILLLGRVISLLQKKVKEREKIKRSPEEHIAKRLDKVRKSLRDSTSELMQIENELQKRNEQVMALKEEAETAKKIAEINEDALKYLHIKFGELRPKEVVLLIMGALLGLLIAVVT